MKTTVTPETSVLPLLPTVPSSESSRTTSASTTDEPSSSTTDGTIDKTSTIFPPTPKDNGQNDDLYALFSVPGVGIMILIFAIIWRKYKETLILNFCRCLMDRFLERRVEDMENLGARNNNFNDIGNSIVNENYRFDNDNHNTIPKRRLSLRSETSIKSQSNNHNMSFSHNLEANLNLNQENISPSDLISGVESDQAQGQQVRGDSKVEENGAQKFVNVNKNLKKTENGLEMQKINQEEISSNESYDSNDSDETNQTSFINLRGRRCARY